MHTPVNHPLRPLYRAVAALAGLYVFLFGIIGLFSTADAGLFERADVDVLGLRTNLAFAVLSVVAGVVILAAAAIGRNIDVMIFQYGGWAFLVIGMAMLALLETDANVLNFSVATCIVSFIIGLALLTAGLYSKVGSAEDAHAENAFRHGD